VCREEGPVSFTLAGEEAQVLDSGEDADMEVGGEGVEGAAPPSQAQAQAQGQAPGAEGPINTSNLTREQMLAQREEYRVRPCVIGGGCVGGGEVGMRMGTSSWMPLLPLNSVALSRARTTDSTHLPPTPMQAMAADPDIYEKLVASVAPAIWQLDDVKRGLLCQVGGRTEGWVWSGEELHALP
jgi:hypothetical protein